jgi:hypothetical protein
MTNGQPVFVFYMLRKPMIFINFSFCIIFEKRFLRMPIFIFSNLAKSAECALSEDIYIIYLFMINLCEE